MKASLAKPQYRNGAYMKHCKRKRGLVLNREPAASPFEQQNRCAFSRQVFGTRLRFNENNTGRCEGYAGTGELSAAIGVAGRIRGFGGECAGFDPQSKESGGAGSVRLKNSSTLSSPTFSREAAVKNLSYWPVVFRAAFSISYLSENRLFGPFLKEPRAGL